MLTSIDIWPDKVELFGQTLNRPDHVSPSQWMDFWEWMKEWISGNG